ncbi:MAG: (Fe-S)-binding protein [Pirellulales bacterium]|nr:(Fe-S)-binding protein [Pirellulales bacterium]
MQVGLFIPCYIDQLFPRVGLATVELLERFGCEVDFPREQTCCGQPMANTGCTEETRPVAEKFFRIFKDYECVVCPSGSCVAMVRHHYSQYLGGRPGFEELQRKTYELCEFLHDVCRVDSIEGRFPYQVGLHNSCHGLRGLRLGSCSERVTESFNKARRLLEMIEGIRLTELDRPDECCGFGGTFAVNEAAVSARMGRDRVADHARNGTQVLTATDMSCLMHLDGIIRRQQLPIKIMHIAEILAGYEVPS